MTAGVDVGAERASRQARIAKLSLVPLVGLVVGSMIGGDVFNLPGDMAAAARPGAIIIGWAISGIGMLALAFVYQNLALRKPELNAGPYAYAKAGFGSFVGFNSAWGYWLSAWLGNVSYAIAIFSALSLLLSDVWRGQQPSVDGGSLDRALADPLSGLAGCEASGLRKCRDDDRQAGALPCFRPHCHRGFQLGQVHVQLFAAGPSARSKTSRTSFDASPARW